MKFDLLQKLLLALAISFGFTAQGHAAMIPITNFNFESPAAAEATNVSGSPAGWSGLSGRFNTNSSIRYYNHPDFTDTGSTGGARGTMNGPTFGYNFATNTGATISNTLTATLQANTQYTFTISLGHRTIDSGAAATASDIRLAIYAGGNEVGTSALFSPSTGIWSDVLPGDTDDDIWADASFMVTTGAAPAGLGSPIQLRILKAVTGDYVDLDNARLDATPVPEPTGWAVLAMAGASVWGLSRRVARVEKIAH